MKVYLINPPANKNILMVREGRCMQRKGAWTTVWPPITLATMAQMLLDKNIDVMLSDCIVEGINSSTMQAKIAKYKPDIVVINTATPSIYSDLACARMVKEVSENIATVAFGIHVSVLTEESFNMEPGLDYIIRGEPEFCLIELVMALQQGKGVSDIKGLSYRNAASLIHNQNRGFEEDLNNLPFPAWQYIDTHKYLLPLSGEPFLLVTTSKGCNHSCLFCPAKAFYGSNPRFRNAQTVVNEMVYVKHAFGVRNFLIWSESFTENREYVLSLCHELNKRHEDIRWVCNSRVDKVDPELLKIMKQAGCWMIGYGVESGNQEILDAMHKDTSVSQIENAIAWSRQAGIEITAHVIFGLPGETLETGQETIDWLRRLDIDFLQAYCAVPWPSTQLYSMAKENLWLTDNNWELYEQNYCVLNTGHISPREIEYLRKKAIWVFYLSLKRVKYLFKKVNSFKKLRLLFTMIKEFITWI